jgi:hypothetical protein
MASGPRSPLRRHHAPLEAATWAELFSYREQLRVWLQDPQAPVPDTTLLTGGHHSQFAYLTPGIHEGVPVVRFEPATRSLSFQERTVPAPVMLIIRLLQGYGGGFNVDDNGTGLSYLRLFGAGRNVQLLRVILNAKADEVVWSNPRPEDTTSRSTFRNIDLKWHSVLPFEAVKGPHDKPARRPRKGRAEAVETSLWYHGRRQHKSDFKLTPDEYRAILMDAFALLDMARAARS